MTDAMFELPQSRLEEMTREIVRLSAECDAAKADAQRLAVAAARAHSLLSTLRLVGSVTLTTEQRELYQSVETDLVLSLAAHQRGEG